MPYLRVLVGTVKDEVKAAASGQPLTLSPHQCLFVTIFDAYLDANVGPSPDHPDGSCVRPRIPCICNECYHVNNFLPDGTKQVFRRQLTKPQRYHIHQKPDASKIDCVHEAERDTYPETLVITKTTTQSQKVVGAWNANRNIARARIKDFPVQALKLLLGPKYQRIVTMEKLYPPGKAPELPKSKPRGKAAAPAPAPARATMPPMITTSTTFAIAGFKSLLN
ncbi:hypothetical protein Sste5346_005007 [Sporothrix stenoceras]|uniref:Uncharacterized protein n=1 Tax=Sporothrix stenoceras TaxID=5173 RepID=A0ABR3Z5S6_9PEZI